MRFVLNIGLVITIAAGISSCSVDPAIKPVLPADNIEQVVPAGWPQPVYKFENNPLSVEKFKLGRELFYEEKLSADNTISCGSCHQNFVAFAHSEHALSHGINGSFGIRNSPGLFNLNWNTSFMWDGGVNHIEVQPLAPITNPVEMNEDMNNVLAKLNADGKYKLLFKNAYGDEEVTTERMFKSLAQFMGMMYSYNSKYDLYKRGEQGGNMDAQEMAGYQLYQQKCASCHTEPLFTDYAFRNNGIAVNINLQDSGRAHVTADPNDRYKFKTPTLRNIMLTAPYMHDGRFNTIDQVLNHYASGVVQGPTLDPQLQSGIQLSAQERTELKAFLNTLTDYAFVYDTRFKDPN
ncbi:MAG: cytochrome-c peroxidase [Bacteroidetes bacterium]|jgi:cytochrome c peroxidase|nr:cytochrome-c peroxidase [Bacteroidota bacterium]